MGRMSERGTVDPYRHFLDAQRRAIEQGRRLAHQGVDLQQQSMRLAVDEMDVQRSLQKKGIDVTRTAVGAYLDAMEASIPGSTPAFANAHALVRGQFEATNELTDRTWEAVRASADEGAAASEELLDGYLGLLDESVEAYVRTLDEFDGERWQSPRTVDVVEPDD